MIKKNTLLPIQVKVSKKKKTPKDRGKKELKRKEVPSESSDDEKEWSTDLAGSDRYIICSF